MKILPPHHISNFKPGTKLLRIKPVENEFLDGGFDNSYTDPNKSYIELIKIDEKYFYYISYNPIFGKSWKSSRETFGDWGYNWKKI